MGAAVLAFATVESFEPTAVVLIVGVSLEPLTQSLCLEQPCRPKAVETEFVSACKT